MSSTIIDIMFVFKLVQEAQPFLKQTPNPDYMQRLDAVQEHFKDVFNNLDANQKAEFALGLWRWCYERACYQMGIDFLYLSSVYCNKEFKLSYQLEGCIALGALSIMRTDHGIAKNFLKTASYLAIALGARSDCARVQFYTGFLNVSQGHLEKAETLFLESLALWEECNDVWWQGACLNMLGLLAWNQGQYELSQERYRCSATLFEIIGDKIQSAKILVNMGILAKNQKHYALALETSSKALTLFRRQANPRMIGIVLYNLGDTLIQCGKLTEANTNLLESLKILASIGYTAGIPHLLISLGITHFHQNKTHKAVKCFGLAHYLGKQYEVQFSEYDKDEIANYIAQFSTKVGKRSYERYWTMGEQMKLEAFTK